MVSMYTDFTQPFDAETLPAASGGKVTAEIEPFNELDLLALLAMLAFTLLLAWYATRLLGTNISVGAVSNTPMEVPM